MRYLITGIGLVGAALAEHLGRDHDLVLFDIRTPDPSPPGKFIEGDIRDLEGVKRAAEGADGIFHTAALHGVHIETKTASEFMDTNVIGTFNALEAAHIVGVKRVVHSSTTGVFGMGLREGDPKPFPRMTYETPRKPRDHYGATKLLCEELCEFYSRCTELDVIALRYGGIRQLVRRVGFDLNWALSGHVTDLDDVVAANVRAMTMAVLPPRPAYTILPTTILEENSVNAAGGDLRAALVAKLPDLYRALPGEIPVPWSVFDASVTESELGIEIKHGQEEFIREALGLEAAI